MDLLSLPQYRGLAVSLRAYAEPDEQGLLPAMRLRDHVVLTLLIAICGPMLLGLVVKFCDERRLTERLESTRREIMSQSADAGVKRGLK